MNKDKTGTVSRVLNWFRAADEEQQEKSRFHIIRENVQWIAISIIIALGIRYFIMEAFKIPTGSMAPTLVGVHKHVECPNCGWNFTRDHHSSKATCPNCLFQTSVYRNKSRGGNRIFVSKLTYNFREPERWDVIVFKYPLVDVRCKDCGYVMFDKISAEGMKCEKCGSTRLKYKRKNYIKRLVGLSGEEIQIKGGDIFINGKVATKPKKTQEDLWVPVYNSTYPPKEVVAPSWNFDVEYWENDKKSLFLDLSQAGGKTSFASFARRLLDSYAYNNLTGANVVGDLRLKMSLTVQKGSGNICLVLERDQDVFQACIPVQGLLGEKCTLKRSQETLAQTDAYLIPGHRHEVDFYHVDGTLRLMLDGKQVLSYDDNSDDPSYGKQLSQSGIKIGGKDVACRFEEIEIFRDIYYSSNLTAGRWAISAPLRIGGNEYFVLGDNSMNSKDSRVWKFFHETDIVGKAFFIFWPLSGIGAIR